jgi:RecB family endonuclease NucS
MATTLKTGKYYLRRKESNCGKVRAGDLGYMREYGKGYLGRFEVARAWQPDPEVSKEFRVDAGFLMVAKVADWRPPLPQDLVIRDLSKRDWRSRLVSITEKDAEMIETAQRIYKRLGFGPADGEIVLLEEGLEEAIKRNLEKMGLRPADRRIQQQFCMGPGVGRSDLICVDANDDLVVIELKRGRSSLEAVGQVSTYVGYVKEKIAKKGQNVHGWIITGSYDERLRLAAQGAGVRVLVVRLP